MHTELIENSVSIFKHIGGFGIICKGYVSERLCIEKEDSFLELTEAYKFAMQARKDTQCEVLWLCEKPSWAVTETNDDIN